MVLILTAGLVLLAAILGLFVVSYGASSALQKWRSRSHVGVYRVRVGPGDSGGLGGRDVEPDVESLGEARTVARSALVEAAEPHHVAFVLAATDDGEWDVVDRIDVL